MNKNDFCPFINGECKSNCTFNCGHYISLGNGNSSKCELAAFISSRDEDDINRISKEITKALQS